MKNEDLKRFYPTHEKEDKKKNFVRYDENGQIPGIQSNITSINLNDNVLNVSYGDNTIIVESESQINDATILSTTHLPITTDGSITLGANGDNTSLIVKLEQNIQNSLPNNIGSNNQLISEVTLESRFVLEEIVLSTWTGITDKDPYKYTSSITLSEEILGDDIITLINDDAVLFAKYGFSILSITNQTLQIVALEQPQESISLKILIQHLKYSK